MQRTTYVDNKVLWVVSTVKLHITKQVAKPKMTICQSDGHNKTFCRTKFHLPTSLVDRGLAGELNDHIRSESDSKEHSCQRRA